MKSIYKSLFATFLITSIFGLCSFNQIDEDIIREIVQKLYRHQAKNPKEKIYLSTTSQTYFSGEVLRFGLQIIDAESHRTSKISKIGHVLLCSENGKVLIHKKIETNNGIGHGDLLLPDTLSTGKLTLLAYTDWMRNYESDLFFKQGIQVINKPISIVNNNDQNQINLSFFPEGGDLHYGVLNHIAFKATNDTGKSIHFAGTVFNEAGDSITSISTYKFGHGKFSFTPMFGKYFVKAQAQHSASFNLPDIQSEGVNLRTEIDLKSIKIDIELVGKSFRKIENIALISQCRGHVNFAALGPSTSQKSQVIIPKSKLENGINQITIFDDQGNPLVERLVFIQPLQNNDFDLEIDQMHSDVKSKNNIKVSSKSNSDSIKYTISVTDSPKSNRSNIVSYIYLESDLKGDIEDPNFYFINNDSAKYAADLLMLTQGWRRFKWEQILSETETNKKFVAEHEGMILKTQMINLDNGKAVKDSIIILSAKHHLPNFIFAKPTNDSPLNLAYYNIHGVHELYLNVLNGSSKKGYDFVIANEFENIELQLPDTEMISAIKINQLSNIKFQENLISNNYNQYLKNQFSRSSEIEFVDKNILNQLSSPNFTIDPDEYIELNNLKELFYELIKCATIKMKKGQNHIHVQNTPYLFPQTPPEYFDKPAIIFVDGIPVMNDQIAFEIPYSRIDDVSIYFHEYNYEELAWFGAVSILTKDDSNLSYSVNHSSNPIKYEGLALKREFYQPKYEQKNTEAYNLPDLRHLLYWNGGSILPGSQSDSFEFYTSDVVGDFYVTLEGITTSGKPVFIQKKFTVRQDLP